MPLFSFLGRANAADYGEAFKLSFYAPHLALSGLTPGIDNVRHDVSLSHLFCEATRQHIARLIVHYGAVQELVAEETRASNAGTSNFILPQLEVQPKAKEFDAADYKRLLREMHVAALNRAKAENNRSFEFLVRLAVLKFQRLELGGQFAQIVERARVKLKQFDGPRQLGLNKGPQLRDRLASFQVSKKAILRKVGQELFATSREVEKETVSRLGRSLFGEEDSASSDLFVNRLLFTEDGRDDYIKAEHYVMLGNYDRDPDRLHAILQAARKFLVSLGLHGLRDEEGGSIEDALSAPENAQELLGAGVPEENTEKGKLQRSVLQSWLDLLENENLISHVMAAYEVVPLLAQYSPYINPQQLKNALISRPELKRVEGLLEEHGKLSPDPLQTAVKRVDAKAGEKAKAAGRFFLDVLRYHRDLRRFDAVLSAMDGVNVVLNERLRELSSINNTLYEFLLGEEQKPVADRVLRHVILKADVRDSTTLTRILMERGQNPASYFSLNFYDPINKLLPKYDAMKVFIEGDAVILALFEHEGEPGFAVARTCVLAKEMIGIVRAYNENSSKLGLPALELGIGISYQDSAPLYLMDGTHRIMISQALNESDRLSSCGKAARKYVSGQQTPFNVYTFQVAEDPGSGDDFLVQYNVGGIRLSAAAFAKLREEISLKPAMLKTSSQWDSQGVSVFSGVVPLGQGVFHSLVVREGRVPYLSPRLEVKQWTERRYYEVCTHPGIYKALEREGTLASSTAQ